MRRLYTALTTAACAALVLTGCGDGASETSDPSSSAQDGTAVASSSGSTDTSPTPTPTPTPTEPPELIGGGTELFPDRRYVALYGHPGNPGLGALGEQGPEASAQRAIKLAEAYQPFSEEKVIPAFEIIATTASSAPGPDGSYSSVSSIDHLMPYIEAAEKNDVYVVLDLQPGHTDFLTQAKIYEELLKRPNVGLALDPEWRLAPGQVHLQQIGSVSAEEINKTTEWLAKLTAENDLPQKAVILHQFAMHMIQNRANINTDHPELEIILHADGHGTPQLKRETWNALQVGLPEDIHMAWKNFYDEDTPTLTPKQTYDIDPKPWFVSYQ